MPPSVQPSISFVIVAFNSTSELSHSLPGLALELQPEDEVIVVDNGSEISPQGVVEEHLAVGRVVDTGSNLGFAAAVNLGVSEANGDLVILLNPDASPRAGFADAIRRPYSERPDWGAWMPLVTCDNGGEKVVNTWGNPVHFTGLSWAGGYGQPLIEAPDAREIPIASGAALVIRPEVWARDGGMPPEFFLYQEDTDLSLRIWSSGYRIGLQPDAVVDHDYDFHTSDRKWFWLERNRLAMVIRSYPGSLLLLLTPAMIATELALLAVSARQGWFDSKLKSYRDLIRWMPRLRGERREIQAARQITPGQFADLLTPDLDSPMIPAFVQRGPIRLLLRVYWKVVRALLP